jgi:phosphoadenosine phosphosulfate reductase
MAHDAITIKNIALFNENLRFEKPKAIISFILQFAKNPLVTTSFGAHSAAILFATTQLKKDIQIIWCDTGYNTDATCLHAQRLIEAFQLNIEIFRPRQHALYLNSLFEVPDVNNPNHAQFAEIVKLEPFTRAMQKHKPDVWFTTVRKDQTSFRNTLDILSLTEDGVLRVSPFYHFNDEQIKGYLKKNNLPVEYDYFDPVKADENRECGIQLLS